MADPTGPIRTGAIYCNTTAIENAVEWVCANLDTRNAERLTDLLTDDALVWTEQTVDSPVSDGVLLLTAALSTEVAQAFKDAGYDG